MSSWQPDSPLWLVAAALVLVAAFAAIYFRIQWQRAMENVAELQVRLGTNALGTGGSGRRDTQLRREIDGMGAALWDLDMASGEIHVSDVFLEATGYRRNELGPEPGRNIDLVHPEDIVQVRHTLMAYLNGESPTCALEFRFKYKSGEYRWIHTRAVASRDDQGRPLRLVGSFTDITSRVEAEEERDRLFNLSIDLLSVGGFDGFLQQVNPAWVRVLGWSRDELMGHPIIFFVHPEDQEIAATALLKLESGDQVDGLEMRFRCRDGAYRWLSWNSFPYLNRRLIFSVVRDITGHKEAERKVLDYQDRLRSMSSQLALVEDRQRSQLATAIHDGLAQQLFGIRAKVTLLKYPEKLECMADVVEETLQILDETMTEARTLSFELFPPVLHEVGLAAALSWLAHQFSQRTGIVCDVASEGEGAELAQDLRAMAYQCVRELLANVRKHAEAERVDITLNHVDRFLTILVDDDGVGFEIDRDEVRSPRLRGSEGFGLFSIRERLRSVEGRMLVDSRPGRGCRVFLSFPVSSQH